MFLHLSPALLKGDLFSGPALGEVLRGHYFADLLLNSCALLPDLYRLGPVIGGWYGTRCIL